MKRFAPLALIVLALALIPAAFADDSTPVPTQPTATTAPATTTPADTRPAKPNAGGRPGVQLRLEILRLRLQIVQLRLRAHCGQNGNASHDRCVAFVQKVVAHLTKLDGNVQAKIAELKNCTPDSTDPKCKNADKKIAILTRVDTYLQNVIQKLNAWLDGKSSDSSSSSSSDSTLDQAAAGLSQAAAGSNG